MIGVLWLIDCFDLTVIGQTISWRSFCFSLILYLHVIMVYIILWRVLDRKTLSLQDKKLAELISCLPGRLSIVSPTSSLLLSSAFSEPLSTRGSRDTLKVFHSLDLIIETVLWTVKISILTMFCLLFPLKLQIKKLRSEILETFFRHFLQLTIITKRSTLGVAAALDPPLLIILTYNAHFLSEYYSI